MSVSRISTPSNPAWSEARRRLRRSVPEATYRMWLEPLSLTSIQAGVAYLEAPERIQVWVERRYSKLIAEALGRSLGEAIDVSFDPPPESQSGGASVGDGLNPAYTFERFVIGEGNHLAHAAALTVAETPAEAYNPLFLHGPPGLGKTHLLSAIANYLAINAPGLTVRYTTAEGFTNEFVNALKNSGIETFKNRYRDLDVLLVDDVQFLEGKQNTEEEFFHTFNALYEGGSQLVLSADRLPDELSTLASRLRDRFEWGLIVPVGRPTLATRRTVLERLIREAGVEVSDHNVIAALAHHAERNIRQLHGALTRLIAHSSLTSRPLDADLVRAVFGSGAAEAHRRPEISVDQLITIVADQFQVPEDKLRGSSRAAASVRARQAAILLAREFTDLSLNELGNRFGGRDHSTIHNAIRRAEHLVQQDPEFAAQINRTRNTIHNFTPAAI